MTDEDKKIVAEYMGWRYKTSVAHVLGTHTDIPFTLYDDGLRNISFDLNDAGLVVQEMQKRGEWEHDFMDYVAGSQLLRILNLTGRWNYHQFIAWLFNAENFFNAFVKWRKIK